MRGSGLVSAELKQFRQTLGPVHVVIDNQHAAARLRGLGRCDLGCRSRLRSRAQVSTSGRRTVKVLPSPRPGLSAVIVPPCSSSSRLTKARPMPSPPSERSRVRFTWVNISNTSPSISGGMPSPVSVTRIATSPPPVRPRVRSAPFGRVLGGIGEEVTHHLSKTGRVGGEPDRLLRQGEFQGVPEASMAGRLASTAVSATACSNTRSLRRISLSLVIRDRSSRSSMRRTMWESWRSIIF